MKAMSLFIKLTIIIFHLYSHSSFPLIEISREFKILNEKSIYQTIFNVNLLEDERLNNTIKNQNNSYKETIKNYKNVQYYGKIFFGSEKEQHSVIFDTGSNILWLPSYDCIGCHNSTLFNYSSSSTYKSYKTVSNITYALGFVKGIDSSDLISLSPLKEKNDSFRINFLLVNEEKELNALADGVLGLGISYKYPEKESYVWGLYTNNLISNPKFTVFLNKNTEKSFIYFGDINTQNEINSNSAIEYKNKCKVRNNIPYWACFSTSIHTESNKIFRPDYNLVVFDTGTSYLILPNDDLTKLVNVISKYDSNTCGLTKYNQLVCKCSSPKDFDNFEIELDSGSTVKVNTEDLIYYDPSLIYSCVFEIIATSSDDIDLWILGDSVLRSTIIEFDMKDKMIRFENRNDIQFKIPVIVIVIGILYLLGYIFVIFMILRMLYYLLFKNQI